MQWAFIFLPPPWSQGSNGASERQMCLAGCGARASLLATSKVSETKENTQLFLQLKAFLPEIKLNSTQARNVLLFIKEIKSNTVTPGGKQTKRGLRKGSLRPQQQCRFVLQSSATSAKDHGPRNHGTLHPHRFKLIKSKQTKVAEKRVEYNFNFTFLILKTPNV